MTEIKWTTHEGTAGRIWWPSLGLLRAWGLMVFLAWATPVPLIAPPFWACWVMVTIVRLTYRLVSAL